MNTESDRVFSIPIRVYIEDTDAGGIVFYANYLKYMERARTEFIRHLGVELRAGLKENISYVVHSLEVKYHKPAKLDDLLLVSANVLKVANTYITFTQEVYAECGALLVSAQVKVACVSLDDGKPRRLSEKLTSALN
jgi:tol-pal system-associated acyl-CoA thioesterase